MKKIFLLLSVVLFLSACSEKSFLNEPAANNEISFIKLPASSEHLAKTVTFNGMINGETGGKIFINHSYVTSEGKSVQITGCLVIPANAFSGTMNISVNLDDEYAVLDFSPSPYHFNAPLKLNLQYKGLDLNSIDQNKVNFYYISDDAGATELINSESKVFNLSTGTIGIIKAELNHFSRFGWVI